MRQVIVALNAILISSVILACTSSKDSATDRNQGPLYIAITTTLSGPLSEFGRSMLRGAKMRIGEDRNQPLYNGRCVRLLALDDKGRSREAVRLTKNMVSHQLIVASIGHLTTGCTVSAMPVYSSAHLILISPVATGYDLETITSPYTFRTILSETQQAESIANYLCRSIDEKRVALISEDSPLGTRLRNAFLSASKKIGLSVKNHVVEGFPFANLYEIICRIASSRVRTIFLGGGPRLAASLVRKWPEDIERPLIVGTHRLISDEFTELAGRHAHGILAAHPCVWASDSKKGNQTRNRYEKKFKYAMDWPAIQTYDAVDLALWAIRKSGSDQSSMRSVLRGRNSKHLSLPGLAGPIYFNRDGTLAREVTVAVYTGSGWKLRKN